MLILRPTDRVPCQIGDVKVWVSPLSWGERNKALSIGKKDPTGMAFQTLRHAIKKVEFLVDAKYSDGSKVEMEYDESGKLMPASLEIVIQAGGSSEFNLLSAAMLTTGLSENIEGIEIDFGNIENTKKKS